MVYFRLASIASLLIMTLFHHTPKGALPVKQCAEVYDQTLDNLIAAYPYAGDFQNVIQLQQQQVATGLATLKAHPKQAPTLCSVASLSALAAINANLENQGWVPSLVKHREQMERFLKQRS